MSTPVHVTRHGRLRPWLRIEIRRLIRQSNITMDDESIRAESVLPFGMRVELRDLNPPGEWQPLDEFRPHEDWARLRVGYRVLAQRRAHKAAMNQLWSGELEIGHGVTLL